MKKYFIFLYLLLPTFLFATNKKALLIGISEYPQNNSVYDAAWSSIHGANDVALLMPTLRSQGFKVNALTNKNATANKIRKALLTLVSESKQGDIIFIHFSGHGQPVKDGINGKAKDEKDEWDEAIVPYDAWKRPNGNYKGANHITDDELQLTISSLRSRVGTTGFVYVVIDACHAGDMQRSEEDDEEEFIRGTNDGFSLDNSKYVPRITSTSDYFKIKIIQNGANICMFEACRSYQVNREIKKEGQFVGALSYYTNKMLKQIKLDNSIKTASELIGKIDVLMKNDSMLRKQNLVIEKSF